MMKKLLLVITLAISSITQAQKGSHEASIDIADAIVMKTLEFSYEYYILDQTSLGLSTLINFAKKEPKLLYKEKTMFTPYVRHYLTDDQTFNYFGEVFFGINSGFKKNNDGSENIKNSGTDLAIGAGVGVKYLSEGGVLVSAIGGVGRNMLGKGHTVVPRFGLSVGYHF